MAHTKSGGSTQNSRDSNPKYLGVKIQDGGNAKPGFILVRQRGTKFVAGIGTKMGRDHTIFAIKEGRVKFEIKRKIKFDGSKTAVNRVSVLQLSK
ncbi:MAG: 50S ribosomal protein L27 [Patescibacteria group bacterium]|mgnify:CR=1 FL=1